jgi:MGT family glycosyltransferase
MGKFLHTVWPFTGHINPNIAIAHELRHRGHEVAFYTGRKFRALIEGEGFTFFQIKRVHEERVEHIVLSPDGILNQSRNPLKKKALWKQWVLETVPQQVADIKEICLEWPTDTIICDPTMWGPFLVLHETMKIPVAVFSLIPACHLSGSDAPIFGFPLPRARNRLQCLRARVLRKAVSIFLADVRREANAIRRKYGLPPTALSVTDLAGEMPLYLVPGSPEFDYQRKDLSPSVHYIGTCLWNKAKNDLTPQWINELSKKKPVIYVSEGTIQLQPRLLKAAAQGLANLPLQVIMTTGTQRNADHLDLGQRPLAPNIRVERWVPLDDLVPHIDAMVTIGGPSTLMAAMERAIPVVIIPFDWDHPETAWRVHESRIGIRLAAKDCTPSKLRHAVQRVLAEPSFRINAKALADSLNQRGGSAYGAELIESLAAEHK